MVRITAVAEEEAVAEMEVVQVEISNDLLPSNGISRENVTVDAMGVIDLMLLLVRGNLMIAPTIS